MARTDTQLKFRIPPDLKPRLEKAARANKRSINMEVIARLEKSFQSESGEKFDYTDIADFNERISILENIVLAEKSKKPR